MKKGFFSIIACAVASVAMAQAPAFPGAEGFGRYTTGGRGGEVRHVTNLNDRGTGSFREAVNGNSKKIVVFDVSGVIALESDINIGANTTIEGQTAPGEGVTVRYYTIQPGENNIIRFIRFRRGQEKNVNDGADASWQRKTKNIILDHCSFSWSIDEVASYYDNRDFTMQWCVIAEPLHNPGHSKGQHGYGGIWGGKGASFHHNFLCHMDNRAPRFNGARYTWNGYDQTKYENTVMAERVDFRNCVVYNWGGGGCYGGPGGGFINMVNNYYKYGPATSARDRVTTCSVANSTTASGCDEKIIGLYSRYFIDGNYVYDYGENYDWQGVVYDGNKTSFTDKYNMYGEGENATIQIKMTEEVPMAEVTTHDAETAFEKVRNYAGASLVRDMCDIRYAEEALNGTATYKGSVTNKYGLLDVVADQGEYYINTDGEKRPSDFDKDNDGMPDEWEIAHGLNPNDPSDAKTYSLDSEMRYYTNIEVYCNSLVEDIMKEENGDAISMLDEYYPPKDLVASSGEPQGGDDVEYEISQSTYDKSPSTTTWNFQDGISVTNTNNKGYSTGKENGIKFSANTQYTIKLPDEVTVSNVRFKGYDNYPEADSYLGELNGVSYGSTQYVWPKKNGSDYYVVEHDVNTTASGSLTFTPQGKQVVWVINIFGKKTTTGIKSVSTKHEVLKTEYYTLGGVKLASPASGINIRKTTFANGKVVTDKIIK